jgi:predicted nucleic acid-binding protein
MTLFVDTSTLDCVRKYGMKTLDSVQLSSAIKSKAGYFVTSDKKLHTIAEDSFKGESLFIGK